jgi:hypothetical protein
MAVLRGCSSSDVVAWQKTVNIPSAGSNSLRRKAAVHVAIEFVVLVGSRLVEINLELDGTWSG